MEFWVTAAECGVGVGACAVPGTGDPPDLTPKASASWVFVGAHRALILCGRRNAACATLYTRRLKQIKAIDPVFRSDETLNMH